MNPTNAPTAGCVSFLDDATCNNAPTEMGCLWSDVYGCTKQCETFLGREGNTAWIGAQKPVYNNTSPDIESCFQNFQTLGLNIVSYAQFYYSTGRCDLYKNHPIFDDRLLFLYFPRNTNISAFLCHDAEDLNDICRDDDLLARKFVSTQIPDVSIDSCADLASYCHVEIVDLLCCSTCNEQPTNEPTLEPTTEPSTNPTIQTSISPTSDPSMATDKELEVQKTADESEDATHEQWWFWLIIVGACCWWCMFVIAIYGLMSQEDEDKKKSGGAAMLSDDEEQLGGTILDDDL